MQHFKSWIIKSLALLLLTSCWGPTRKSPDLLRKESADNASFYIKEASGESIGVKTQKSGKWNVTQSKTYRFSACLAERQSRQIITRHPFQVKSDERIFPASTLDNGCIEWTEDGFDFNYYAPSTYLLVERKISPAPGSVHYGEKNIKFLVNPWAGFRKVKQVNPEVLYWAENSASPVGNKPIAMGAAQVSAALNGLVDGKKATAKLYIEDPNILVTKVGETHNGYDLALDLTLKPFIILRNINGEVVRESIDEGEFKIYAELVATDLGGNNDGSLTLNNDKHEILTDKLPPSKAMIRADGYLRAHLESTFSRRVTEGRLKLALRVIPHEGPADIEHFDGLYVVGNYNKLVTSAKPTLERDRVFDSFNFLEYIKRTDEFETLKKKYIAHENRPFDFTIAKGTYERVVPGETATQRSVQFKVETCPIDNALAGEKVKLRQFEVYRNGVRLNDKDSQTKEDGCLLLMGEVSHAYYKTEMLIDTHYEIFYDIPDKYAKSGKVKKGKYDLIISTNPWDDKFTFFRDKRQVSEELRKQMDGQKKVESRFYLSQFSYQTLSFGYEIDDYLNLTVKKSILLRLEPWVLRPSGIVSGRQNIQPLRPGIYLLKVAFEKKYLDPATKGVIIERNGQAKDIKSLQEEHSEHLGKHVDLKDDILNRKQKEYISVIKKLVRVDNGVIITPITLNIQDLRLMRVRSQFMIQLQPIDERVLFAANEFDSKFSEEVNSTIKESYNRVVEQIQAKHGPEAVDSLQKYMGNLSEDVRRLVQFRSLPDEDRAAFKEVLRNKQEDLESMVRRLQEPQLEKQKRAIDSPEAMREILTEFDIYDQTIEKMKLADFTVTPAAALVQDLDVLVEPFEISGLNKRTFIGPLTFILNSNHSSVRPTDNLDEGSCLSEDCDSIKMWGLTSKGLLRELEGEYRNSEYYGSIKWMAGLHVDDMIKQWNKLQERYERVMKLSSQTSNFVNLFGYKFVSLKDEGLISVNTKDPRCASVYDENYDPDKYPENFFMENCLVVDNSHRILANDFLKMYKDVPNSLMGKTRNHLDRNMLAEIVRTGKMDSLTARGFCGLFIAQMFNLDEVTGAGGYVDNGGWFWGAFSNETEGNYYDLKETCFDYAKNKDTPSPFVVDRRLRIHRLGKNYVFKGGKQMNVNVGANVGLSRDERFGFSPGGINVAGILGPLGRILKASADYHRNKSSSEGTVISEQTFLVMQTAAFDLKLEEYEYCAAIKWNPEIFEGEWYNIFTKLFSERGKQATDILGGFFICNGEVQNEPIYVRENYFYFTQHFTDGDMLDSGDLYNHPWLLALRGNRDVSRFISQLTTDKFVLANVFDSVRKGDRWPIYKMIEVYLKTLPTFPRMHTLYDDYGPNYPWREPPEHSFTQPIPETLDLKTISEDVLGIPGYDEMMKILEKDTSSQNTGVSRFRKNKSSSEHNPMPAYENYENLLNR